jgi:hypothetical protein
MLQNDPVRLPPFHFDADPDPDPAFKFDADLDPQNCLELGVFSCCSKKKNRYLSIIFGLKI